MKKISMILTAGLLFIGAAGFAQSAEGMTQEEKKAAIHEKYGSKEDARAAKSKAEKKQSIEHSRQAKKKAMIEKYGSEEAAKEAARAHRAETHQGQSNKKEEMKAKSQSHNKDEMKAKAKQNPEKKQAMQQKKKKKG